MKRKNIIIYSLFAILIGICVITPAKADSEVYTNTVEGLKYGSLDWQPELFIKSEWADNYVQVDKAQTSITNPCPKCQIAFKLRDIDGGYYTGKVMTMNSGKDSIRCSDGCSAPNVYNIALMRSDYTLMKTTVKYTFWW